MFPDDDENEEIDDKFAEDILAKAHRGYAFVDVDDIADAYSWFQASERGDDARTVLDYGLGLHPGNAKLLIIKAMSLIDVDELAKASDILDYVTNDAAEDPNYYVCRGWLELRRNESAKAEQCFDKAVKVTTDDNREQILSEITSNLIHFEMFSMSEKFFEMLPEEYFKSSEQAAFEYGYALSFVGKDAHAIKLYEQIVDKNPFYDGAWYNLGILYCKNGQVDKAIDAYTNCTDANPEYAEAYFNIGNIYLEQDNIASAIECYTEYLSLALPEPEMRVYAYLGDCWLRADDVDLASRILSFAVKKMPDNDAAWYDLGRCYLEKGFNARAVHVLRKALGLNPYVANYHFGLAQAFLNTGNVEKATTALEDGLRCSPGDVLAWFELIRLKFNLDDCDTSELNDFLDRKKREFGSPKALLLVEAYVEFFVFRKKRTATTLLRNVAKNMPQVIMDASEEPSLSKLFEQKGMESILNEYNIKLK